MNSHRKLTRFYVINPVTDRRREHRFESRESVVVRLERIGKTSPATAYDIGQTGLRLETLFPPEIGSDLQLVFPNTADHVRCFARVVWSRPLENRKSFESGLSIEEWHGFVEGGMSWKRYHGLNPKGERRQRKR